MIPVVVMRVDQNHRIVRGTTAQRPGARIQDPIDALAIPIFAVLVVATLQRVAGVMTHKEIPLDRVIFGREWMGSRGRRNRQAVG